MFHPGLRGIHRLYQVSTPLCVNLLFLSVFCVENICDLPLKEPREENAIFGLALYIWNSVMREIHSWKSINSYSNSFQCSF